ncbi:MAG TPA: extracellular solute-binding protein [Burkholderiales bacterium]
MERRRVLAALAGLIGNAAVAPSARGQDLLQRARREGTLTVYTSFPPEDIAAVNALFEKRTGVKVRPWRSSSENVLQRTLAETRSGRFDVDVVECNSIPLETLHREGVLQRVQTPGTADLVPAAVPKHGEWVASRLSLFVQAYNTRQVRKDELPKSYADLLDPRWKGRLGVEAADMDWFSEVVRGLGEEKGLKLFRDLVATNGLSVRRGHSVIAQLVATGDIPLALTVYNFTAEQLKRRGAPLDWFVLPPAVAHANGVAIPKRAPRPHAALLYYEFMIGEEAQRLLASRDSIPTSTKVESALDRSSFRVVDPARMLDEGERWAKVYDEIIVKGSR